ncbi:MAG: ATP-dependent zinc protease [Gammaproteobacteria bacterium]|nr:ATP-dependent zinc protease [Gammaproteobacteria bacterium]
MGKLVAVFVVLLLAGCQHANLLIDEADLSRFDECVALQQALLARVDAQSVQLEAIQGQTGYEPAVMDQLDALWMQLADMREELAPRDCPEFEGAASVIAVEASSDMLFAGDKLVVGEIENVRFDNLGMELRARIDTGAVTSSLHAENVRRFQRDGDNWVRFTIQDPETGEPVVLERPRSRRVRIVQAGAEDPSTRAVVELRVTLGNSSQTAEFTLADRSALEFPVLIGRNILRDLMVVDVSKTDAAPLPPRSGDATAGAE